MKLAVLSYSHHRRRIGRTARDLGHEIVGVMDGEENPRTQLENEFGCPGFDTAGACLDAVQPEAALISGKHIEIPSHIQLVWIGVFPIWWINRSPIVLVV